MTQRTRRRSSARPKARAKRASTERVRPFISTRVLTARVKVLGRAISRDYAGRRLTLVCVLKGAALFFSDLAREIKVPVELEFIGVTSYAGATQTSGEVRISTDVARPLAGKDVLLVEDIVDTGLTAAFLVSLLQARNPKSLAVCALLEKPSRARTAVQLAYRGFVIPDVFVVGYGLDFQERYRNLPYLGVLQSSQNQQR
jgi:hypoxanthine phosphoribosyltransferase